MTTSSRSAIRKSIAASLAANLTSVQQVVDHQASDTGSASPLVRVLSGGSLRPPSVPAGDDTRFYVIVQAWVLFSEIPDAWARVPYTVPHRKLGGVCMAASPHAHRQLAQLRPYVELPHS